MGFRFPGAEVTILTTTKSDIWLHPEQMDRQHHCVVNYTRIT